MGTYIASELYLFQIISIMPRKYIYAFYGPCHDAFKRFGSVSQHLGRLVRKNEALAFQNITSWPGSAASVTMHIVRILQDPRIATYAACFSVCFSDKS